MLTLVQDRPEISRLIHNRFRGFTYQEKKRRLIDRCNKDFFVCLKNIFENDSFDLIVLREYSAIVHDVQNVCKYICALETLSVVVHRQLVICILQVDSQSIGNVLQNLDGLVDEFDINPKEGIFGWRGRHQVISEIITKHKFNDPDAILDLLRRVIGNLSPSYDVEIRTMRQLFSPVTGIGRVLNIDDQNELLRMMISIAPRERVSRHRLISNLIRQGSFADAETEIRVFENDLGVDGPVRRHKVRLILERAVSAPGLLAEDRATLLNKALDQAQNLVDASPQDTYCLKLLGDVCFEIFRFTGDYSITDLALERMKEAEKIVSDPEITSAIRRLQGKLVPSTNQDFEFKIEEVEEDSTQQGFDE